MLVWLLLAMTSAQHFRMPETISEEDKFNFHQLVPQNARNIALLRWPDSRGHSFVVSRPIQKGLPVLVMDPEYILTSFDAYPWAPLFEDAPAHIQLMARLIYEKFEGNENSLIYNYLGTLPLEYHLMVNFTNSDWQLLDKHRTFERRIVDVVDVVNTHPVFVDTVKNSTVRSEVLELESWKWAYCTATSRAFAIGRGLWKQLKGYAPVPADNFYEGLALAPFLDLPNHSPLPLKYRHRNMAIEKPFALGTNPRGMYLLADRDFPEVGVEFTYSYGNLTNLGLLAQFGFILDKNLDDIFPVLTPIPGPCFAIKNEEACEYIMQAYELNTDLLHHVLTAIEPEADLIPASVILEYYEDLPRKQMTKGKFLAALKQYREHLVRIRREEFKQALRTARRQLAEAREDREKLLIRYGVSEKVLVYEHLKLTDRTLLALVAGDLAL